MALQVTKINPLKIGHQFDKHTEDTDDGKSSSDLIKIRNGTILLVFVVLLPVPLMS